MHDVQVENLTKRYAGKDGVLAVDGVDLTVAAGEMLVLLGPSGCGKTTLLRCIAGLERPDGGTVRFGDLTLFDAAARTNLPPERRRIGMVFQNYSLWPHMSVATNVAYPLRAQRVPRADRAGRVGAALSAVHCEQLADRLPAMLSGGQQQRIALARALVSSPEVMLLDEPLSNLDALLRVDLRSQLREIHRKLGFTGVYVTHDQSEAFSLGTRVAVMKAGRIEQLGPPEEVYESPVSEYVAAFLGIRNSITARYANEAWRTPAGPLHGDCTFLTDRGREHRIFIRPEAIDLSSAEHHSGNPQSLRLPPGTVVDAAFGGDQVDYEVDVGGEVIHATLPVAGHRFRPGDSVVTSFSRDAVLVYVDGERLDDSRSTVMSGAQSGILRTRATSTSDVAVPGRPRVDFVTRGVSGLDRGGDR